jgi:hypothetical protein|nr:MAG TPA_asm: hypothetical protein [Caudoviricetes sp.]
MNSREAAKLSLRMKSEAVDLGLCQKWTEEWADGTSKDGMVDKFVRGIDFCIEHNWPSPKVMKRDFGDVIHNHGVYVDENVDAHNPPIVILNGECVANVTYTGTATGEVYVRHQSEARIRVEGLTRCFVNLYDEGSVSIDCDDGCKVFVYQYGGCVRKVAGDVTIRDKRDEEK